MFGPDSNQSDIFAQAEGLVTSVLDGYNVCIFAYGPTGSGKTHTMEGPPGNRGLNFRALDALFAMAEGRQSDHTYKLALSAVEIYNEQLRDLLAADSASSLTSVSSGRRHEIRSGPRGMYVTELTEVQVTSSAQVQQLLASAKENRAVAVTNLNEHSSRSHLYVVCDICGAIMHARKMQLTIPLTAFPTHLLCLFYLS